MAPGTGYIPKSAFTLQLRSELLQSRLVAFQHPRLSVQTMIAYSLHHSARIQNVVLNYAPNLTDVKMILVISTHPHANVRE